jgi:hypothetical protein
MVSVAQRSLAKVILFFPGDMDVAGDARKSRSRSVGDSTLPD